MSSPAPQRPADPTAAGVNHDDEDLALRQALRRSLDAGGASPDEHARLADLHTRWMQDWAHGVGVSPVVPDAVADRLPAKAAADAGRGARPRPHTAARGWLATGGAGNGFGRAPRWFGGLGVALALGAAVLLWQRHQNELLLDELSQVDVLSQMAAGEM